MTAFHSSIRWRMQVWHGLLLLAVLTAFGTTAYWLIQDNHLRRVDQELQRRLAMVAASVRLAPPMRPMSGGPVPSVMASAEQEAMFAAAGGVRFYYLVWFPDGTVLNASTNAPADVPQPKRDGPLMPGQGQLRTRGTLREASLIRPLGMGPGPRGGAVGPRLVAVLVGCSMVPEWAELQRFAWLLAVAGASVLALGLAMGWWLSARAILPIAQISAAAHSISEGNLAERINPTETDSELGQLAVVLNRTFDRLQSVLARQAQFTADASHELRTPLAVILSQTQTALKRERPPEEYREALAASQRAAQRMARLTDSLMLLARLDGGSGRTFQPVCLDQVVRDVVQLLRPLAEEQTIRVQTELASLLCAGDEEQLHQLVTNLLSNAIRYNRPGGSVILRLVEAENSCLLHVTDTGLGIAPEHLPQVFDRFYRADQARSRANGGTGLGLAIAAAVAHTHGGTLEVTSEVNVGSTFTVRLPRFVPDDNEAHRTSGIPTA
jgi:heavy metal sensor kinase